MITFNLLQKKDNFYKLNIVKFLFYTFPIILFFPSGIINFHASLLTIFGIITIYKLKYNFKLILVDYIIFIFFFLNFISTLNNYSILGNIILFKSILSFRFLIFFWVIRNLFVNKIVSLFPLSFIALISSILLSLDILLQHITGEDIFGFTSFSGRFNGFFEHEAIAGSYIQKFLLLSLLIILLLNQNRIIKIIIITLVINILGLGVLLSLDRMPYVIFIFSIFLLLIFLKNFRLMLLFNLIILFLVFVFFLKNYDILKNRYENLNRDINLEKLSSFIVIDRNFKNITENKNFLNYQKEEKIFIGDYSKLFYSAYLISLKNNFIGSGHKSFVFECLQLKQEKKSCNNHPHNIYLEILVNLGILGIFIFILILFLLIKEIINTLIKNNINNTLKVTLILFLVYFISELFPFRTFGSIFTSVNGYIFWFFFGLLSITKFQNYYSKN